MAPLDGNQPQENLEDFIDPKGYWADAERAIRRTSGDRQVVLKATNSCTEAEWMFVLESLGVGTIDEDN
ncbi:MAG: hypothetical protein JO119_17850 [Acidobacteria bacterium]|nr:hypothetical protein [Acidobacteriota bacterium]